MSDILGLKRHHIGLVLSDGGARALAHVGVLEAIEKAGILPNLIVGTGFGAFIGAAFAAKGSASGLREFIMSIPNKSFFELNRRNNMGIFVNDQLIGSWLKYTGCRKFEEFHIPTKVVVSELSSGTFRVLDKGDFAPCLEMSLAWPGIHAIVQRGKEFFSNGNDTNPLPIDVARDAGATWIIASDMASQRCRIAPERGEIMSPWEKAFLNAIPYVGLIGRQRAVRLLLRGLELMHTTKILWQIEKDKPDLLFQLEKEDARSEQARIDDFEIKEDIMDLGKEIAESVLARTG